MSNLLSQASLVMIPSGYKEDVVYSAIPTNGNGDLSFTRASNGTRVNSAGLVEVVAWNLASYSEEFDNAGWTKSGGSTITSNNTTAPNGTLTADRINVAASTYSGAYQFINQPNGIYTNSIYAKAGTFNYLFILINGSSGYFVWFNLSTGTIGSTGTNMEGTIESVGNGWYRCTASRNLNNDRNDYIQFGFSNAIDFTPTTTGTAFIWGAQANIGSTAKPYFPTTDRLNVPRLTYQNGGGGCPSLLLEKQSTNLTLYSQDLGNAVHNLLNVTIASNNTTSPDGTQNADKFTETTATGEHIIYDLQSNSAGAYTVSCFLKQGSGTIYPVLRLNNTFTGDYALIIFDFTSGTVINTSNVGYGTPSHTVANLGNGWYRVTMTSTTTGTFGGLRLAASDSASPSVGSYGAISYTGSTNNYFYAYGAQVEASSYPTSYIPTTSSSATRVADACSKTGISSLIGQTSGSVFFDFTVDTISAQTNDPVLWYMKDGGSGERYVELYSNGNLEYVEFNGATIIASIVKTGLTVGRHKCAIGYANNDMVLYVDGVQIGTDVSGTPSGFSTFGLQYINSTYFGQQRVNQVALFPTRLTNAELASLTTI